MSHKPADPTGPKPATPGTATTQELILKALDKFPRTRRARIERLVPHPPADITHALEDLISRQLIYLDSENRYSRMTDAQRNALNTKRKSIYHKDEHEKILRRTRAKMLRLLNHGRPRRNKKFAAILGLESMAAFRDYLESQFQPGMTWENHGVGAGHWNIDHIKPCASFDLTDPDQFAACWHHTNMRPLWAEENLALQARAKAQAATRPDRAPSTPSVAKKQTVTG